MIKVSTNNNKNGLAYSSKDINRNFRIKVSGVDAQGRKVHKLVGVAGAIALIGVEMLNKLLKRAFACMDDVCVCKLRRGIKFSFYYKQSETGGQNYDRSKKETVHRTERDAPRHFAVIQMRGFL